MSWIQKNDAERARKIKAEALNYDTLTTTPYAQRVAYQFYRKVYLCHGIMLTFAAPHKKDKILLFTVYFFGYKS